MAEEKSNPTDGGPAAKSSGSGSQDSKASGQAPPTAGKTTASAGAAKAEKPEAKSSGDPANSAIEMLKADHRMVEKLFDAFEGADPYRKTEIIQQACEALVVHTLLEEQVFYPACRDAANDEAPLDEAQVEHDGAKVLIAELLGGNSGDRYRDAKFKVLAEQVRHHVREEEESRKGIFALAKKAGVDTPKLARRLAEFKERIETDSPPEPTRPV